MTASDDRPLSLEAYDDPAAFAAAVTPFLERHEAENGLLLGVANAAITDRPPRLDMVRAARAGETVFAAFRGHFNLIVTGGPDQAIDATAAHFHAAGVADLGGVVGPAAAAGRFATVWAGLTGRRADLAVRQRIYQLGQVRWPSPPIPGRMRPLVPADLDLTLAWRTAFDHEALAHELRAADDVRRRQTTERRLATGDLFAWEVDGAPVSMAGLARPTRHGISVNAVYTPPEHRRRGFATALVAAVSQAGLERGKRFCVLYTDLANPTSNAIYQRIGYAPVCDSNDYLFAT